MRGALDPVEARRWTAFEVLVFLSLVVPPQVLSLFAGQPWRLGFDVTAAAVVLRDGSLAVLVLFFVLRNGEKASDIGLTLRLPWAEAALGVLLFLPFNFFGRVLEARLQAAGFSAPSRPLPAVLAPRGGVEIALAVALVLVVAVTEEIIFRGYLISRFRSLTHRPGLSVWLSAVIFALGHAYEGSSGMITVGAMGLVFGMLYVWRGNLVAPMTLHFLQDFTGIVIGPVIGTRAG